MSDNTLDRIRGMFMGAFLGDALGAPVEFKCNSNVPYTGKLEHKAFMVSKFQGKKELSVGQCTDDTEMTLALLRTIIRDQCYNRDHVVIAYLKWANSGGWMMGKNTRTLLKGVTTVKGYQGRINKILSLPICERSQSNGALMRCSPLSLISDNTSIIQDVDITNPNPVCEDCNIIYVNALRLALQGYDGISILTAVKDLVQTDEIKEVLDQVEKREFRDITKSKGWCLHGLWCALIVITSNMNYSEAMRWIITQRGSDTDTNACIAGALLGAKLGFNIMGKESDTAENIQILLNCNTANGPTPRPLEYSPSDFLTLMDAAHKLYLNCH